MNLVTYYQLKLLFFRRKRRRMQDPFLWHKMFDIQLRSLKDGIFRPMCKYVPSVVTPLHITAAAFVVGFFSCYFSTTKNIQISLTLWALNRALDCLDGALARHRGTASDLGGFLDLLGDFIVYSLLPISIAAGWDNTASAWKAVAVLEASFHINNFVLFYVAAVAEKRVPKGGVKAKELTSVMMRPALVEGTESGLIFTAMLAWPGEIEWWCWGMAGLVAVGIAQRVACTVPALS